MGDRDATTHLRDGSNRTGGPGGGRELAEHGYQVVATDIATTRDDLEAGALRADLTDYGQSTRGAQGRRRRYSPGEHPGARAEHAGGHLQRQRHDELQRLPRCSKPRPAPGRVGVERDDARPPLRHAVPGNGGTATAICPGRRGSLPGADEHIRALEGCERDDCRARGAVVRNTVRRAPLLQHHGRGRLRGISLDVVEMRTRASGISGVTWTSATSPLPAAWPSRRRQRRLQAARASSSPQRTPS